MPCLFALYDRAWFLYPFSGTNLFYFRINRPRFVAGADLAIIVVLLKQIGIPFTAIALIMGVDTLLDMMQAMCNTTSDGAIALIVAKRVGELDMAKYTSD